MDEVPSWTLQTPSLWKGRQLLKILRTRTSLTIIVGAAYVLHFSLRLNLLLGFAIATLLPIRSASDCVLYSLLIATESLLIWDLKAHSIPFLLTLIW